MGTLLIQLHHSDKKTPEDKNAHMEEENAEIIFQKTEQQGSDLCIFNL